MYQQQIAQCDQQIEGYLASLDSQVELEAIESVKNSPPAKKYSIDISFLCFLKGWVFFLKGKNYLTEVNSVCNS